MNGALGVYRFLTGGAGAVASPIGRLLAPSGSPWRARFGAPEGVGRSAGGPWIHAASMGEAVAALRWVDALLAAGYRAPLFVTTRTAAGLERVRGEADAKVVAAAAPIDFPQAVRRVLRDAAPMRLDLIETELWPNLLYESHAAGVAVVAVSATVSARSASRLRSLGLGGEPLFGPLHVLAQSERHAERFRSLGVAADRCRVIGDLKADTVPEAGADSADPASRRLVVFASLRPGEEEAAVTIAHMLAARSDAETWRYVVAPRHDRCVPPLRVAFARAGIALDVRDDSSGAGASVADWEASLAPAGRTPSAGMLATRGELSDLLWLARAALVGGTFAPWGGHNVLEPAARSCPVIVGPHHEEVEAGVSLLLGHEAGAVAPDGAAAAAILSAWLDERGSARAAGALAAARAAGGAAKRGLLALAEWGLEP
ncbi:MAG: glycosyltransferase N-terminal domain-containing protein [Candidatus Eisenbacteria bacterium]